MTNFGGNTVPRIEKAEHIGPSDTGDNIEAKRVATYAWNGSTWERQSSLSGNPPSSVAVTLIGDTITSAQLIAANSARKEIEFYNISSATLYLLKGAGTASSTNCTVQISVGDYYSSNYTGEFNGVWSSDAGGTVSITEST